MEFFKRHWFKILILLPMIPVGILIYSLERFGEIDRSLRLLAAFALGIGAWGLVFFGCTLELSKGNIEKRKIKFDVKGFKFGIVEILRVLYSVLIIVVCYSVIVLARTTLRIDRIVDEIAAPVTETHTERMYSFVAMSDFNPYEIGSYGRIGILSLTGDEATEMAIDEFLLEQNFIPNFIPRIFDSPLEMIAALYNNEIDSMVITSNFAQIFDELELFEDIESDTVVLDQLTVEIEIAERENVDPAEPFSILFLGLNQNDQALTSGTINVFMLLTVNLEELSLTITSIPRDSYVFVPSWGHAGVYDKLSHTNFGGTATAIETIEHMFDMEIPFYVKLNFTGFMSIIDVLGGIEVDVPLTFSEQNSNRQFGEHMIHLEAGLQRLSAEEALALSRHRNNYNTSNMRGDDFTRVAHQQLVFEAILAEMFSQTNGISDVFPLLEVIGQHLETNLNRHEIITIAEYMLGLLRGQSGSDLMNELHIINKVIYGCTEQIFVRNYPERLWVSHPHPERIEIARQLMMVNLGLERAEFEFEFAFNGFEPSRRNWGPTTAPICVPGGVLQLPQPTNDAPQPPLQQDPVPLPADNGGGMQGDDDQNEMPPPATTAPNLPPTMPWDPAPTVPPVTDEGENENGMLD